ncbi:MAG: creatininase family protein [Candidatus Egerieousia sp.]
MYSKYDITTARWGDVSKMGHYHLAILPWGSTEPHNRHLPYCTDMLCAQAFAFDVAEAASERGVNVMVLPGIPLGSQNPGQVELPYCIHTTQQTQFLVLRDIVNSLKKQGITKLLIMSGHGGNIFKGMIRDLNIEDPTVTICHNEWFSFIPRSEYFEEKEDDHAGEQETSVMLHYYPELVDMSLAGDGNFRRFAIEGLNKKVAWAPRDWAKTTSDTGVGYPKKATAEKGRRYVEAVLPKIIDFVTEFAKSDSLY